MYIGYMFISTFMILLDHFNFFILEVLHITRKPKKIKEKNMKENKRGHHKEGKIEEVNPNYIKN